MKTPRKDSAAWSEMVCNPIANCGSVTGMKMGNAIRVMTGTMVLIITPLVYFSTSGGCFWQRMLG